MLDTLRGVAATLPVFGLIVATRAVLPINPFRLPRVIVDVLDPPAAKLI